MTIAVYVSNAGSGTVSVLHLDPADGALRPVQTAEVGGTVMPLALGPPPAAGVRRRLYAARRSEPLAVVGFDIDPADGTLAALGEAPLPASMAYIATDASGRWLFGASYGDGLVAVAPLDAAGRPPPAQQVVATGPKAHAIRSAPGNRFVCATSLGDDAVLTFGFDAATGRLTPTDPGRVRLPAGSGPRHLVFDRAGRFAYVIGELDAAITVLGFDAATGRLTPLQTVASRPPGLDGDPWAAEIRLTPDGRFLYASERRSSTLAAFGVDAATGRLAPIGHVATEAQPRGFAITPDGRFIVAAGQRSGRVGVHAIDPQRGTLTRLGGCAVGHDPNWVEALAVGA